jgi:hypothetical protein
MIKPGGITSCPDSSLCGWQQGGLQQKLARGVVEPFG